MAEEKVVSKGGGWTDAEKIALLVTMLENKGGPDWKGLKLPPGRTQKACTHVWTKLKQEAARAEWYQAGGAKYNGAENGEDGPAPSTPASTKKRGGDGGSTGKAKRTKKDDEETPIKDEEEV